MGNIIIDSVFNHRSYKVSIPYLLIILLGLFSTSHALANVNATGTLQTPANDVVLGGSVSYGITLNSTDASFVDVRILLNGQPITSSFTSTAGGCSLDGDTYFCDQQAANSQELYEFNWTPPATGTFDLTFDINCFTPQSESCLGDSVVIQTIVRDFLPGDIQFSATTYQATEGTAATITVTRTGGSDGVQVADIIIGGGNNDTATVDDYTPPPSTRVTFNDGETTPQTIDILINADDIDEQDETVTLTLQDPILEQFTARAIGTPSTAILTLIDTTEPGTLQFSADQYQATEGDVETIIVQRIGGSDGTVIADIFVGSEGDTASPNTDYTSPANTQLVFADGVTSQSFDIQTLVDTLDEGDETVALFLALNPDSQGTVGTPSEATLIISDPVPEAVGELNFSSASYAASEQDGTAVITVTRTGGSAGILEADVQLGAEGDTASTDDYTVPASTRLSWADGDTADKVLNIPITADQIVESDETLTLGLLAVNNSPIGETSQAVLIITDVPPDIDTVGIVSGDLQSGTTGTVLDPFVILVSDINGNPVENTVINWEVSPANAGTLETVTTQTDVNGNSSNILTLNSEELVLVTARATDPTVDPIIFQINGKLINTTGLTENQQSIIDALTAACQALRSGDIELTAAQQDLLATCNRIEASEDPGAELDLLIPDEVSSQGTAVIKAANLQVMNVNSRLNALRSGASGFNLSGLGIQVEGVTLPKVVLNQLSNGKSTGGAAGEGDTFNRWGAFINGNISFGSKDRTTNENGFDFDTRGITAGLDYRVSNDLIVGAALGYGTNKSDFDSSTGDMDMDGWHITGYGTYYKNQQMYIDGVIKLGFNSYDTTRRVSPTGTTLQNALADTDGKELSLSLGGGYEFAKDAMTIGSYGRIGYTTADIDGYTEVAQFSGVPGIGSMLSIADQDVDSLTTTLGAEVSYSISTKKGVFVPQARLEWEHEFSDDQRDINAQFLADPTSTTFGIRTDEADSDYFNLGLGFSTVTTGGKSGFLYYETRIDQDDIEQHWIKGGFRFEF